MCVQDECNDWIYASKVVLAELTGDESIIDTDPPKREIAKPSTKDQLDWPDTSTERRKVNRAWVQEVLKLFLCLIG